MHPQIFADQERAVIYGGLAYRRDADCVLAALPQGRSEAIPLAAVPLPVRHALGIADVAIALGAQH